jgi:ribosomal protein L37E
VSDPQASQLKICAICGKDCSGQKRIKDKEGRYYHRACFQQAKQARKAKSTHRIDREEETDPYALDLDEKPSTGTVQIEGEEVPTHPCPNCGKPMSTNAMTCGHCGFNRATGTRQPKSYADMAQARIGDAGTGKVWSMIVGILSMLLGIAGLIYFGLGVFRTAMSGELVSAFPIGLLSLAAGAGVLSLWLLLAGLGIFRRSQISTMYMRSWAIICILFLIIGAACIFIGALAMEEVADGLDSALGADIAGEGIGSLIAPTLTRYIWLLIWPVFLLIWLARKRVQKQIGDWD